MRISDWSSDVCSSDLHGDRDGLVFGDFDHSHVADLGIVGDGADRALAGFQNLERNLGPRRQKGAAPAPRAEGAARREAQNVRADRHDRYVCRKAVGGAAGWRRPPDAIADPLLQPADIVYIDEDLRPLQSVAQPQDPLA